MRGVPARRGKPMGRLLPRTESPAVYLAVSRAGGEQGPGTPRLCGRKRGPAPHGRGGAGADADSLGREACNLGGPLPFTSPHPAWLFIASFSLRTHLPMFLGQTSLETQRRTPLHTHAAKLKGRQHSGQASRASPPEAGLPRPQVAPPCQTGVPQGRRRPQRRQQPSQTSVGVSGRR